nr:MAG TPA: hypothetical protein [Caudoviricetes sp.]
MYYIPVMGLCQCFFVAFFPLWEYNIYKGGCENDN